MQLFALGWYGVKNNICVIVLNFLTTFNSGAENLIQIYKTPTPKISTRTRYTLTRTLDSLHCTSLT